MSSIEANSELLMEAVRSLPIKSGRDRFRVFLFGPGLNEDEQVDEPSQADDIAKHARYLRFYLASELRKKGWVIDFGESPQVMQAWSGLGVPMDDGRMEYLHAFAACGAVIILPSSPGSFCEMGLFATSKEISQKTLAIVHQEYETSPSFFRKGLVRIFQQRDGRCAYKCYRDKRMIFSVAEEFVEDRFNSHQWDNHEIAIGKKRSHAKKSSPY